MIPNISYMKNLEGGCDISFLNNNTVIANMCSVQAFPQNFLKTIFSTTLGEWKILKIRMKVKNLYMND